jgi:hypothetical protein
VARFAPSLAHRSLGEGGCLRGQANGCGFLALT